MVLAPSLALALFITIIYGSFNHAFYLDYMDPISSLLAVRQQVLDLVPAVYCIGLGGSRIHNTSSYHLSKIPDLLLQQQKPL